jgi:SAM-dependent methyltransferase/uncharacterized protein YbaR (Trm112 family)
LIFPSDEICFYQKGVLNLKPIIYNLLVSPQTHLPLKLEGNRLITESGEQFDIWNGVPVLLPKETNPNWHREMVEAILWQYPEEIKEMYAGITSKDNWAEIYVNRIRRLLGNKEKILAALQEYSEAETDKWIYINQQDEKSERQKKFRRYSSWLTGKKRVSTKRNAKGIYRIYPIFSRMCLENSPQTVVELATGAGGGTAAIALNMSKSTELFTVDIDAAALGNAIGIGKYTKKKENIFPVCANFWYLPFTDLSIDTVCTYCGLDESRENDKTLSEIARILRSGGRFVCVCRKNAFMRQANILEPFGFTEEETVKVLRLCRMYSCFDDLVVSCKNIGLSLVSSKKIKRNETTEFVVAVFEKA